MYLLKCKILPFSVTGLTLMLTNSTLDRNINFATSSSQDGSQTQHFALLLTTFFTFVFKISNRKFYYYYLWFILFQVP
jgi:ubiquitin C-terminal hydrolase